MKRILVVDDVPERISDIQQEVTFSFQPEQFEVQGAASIQEAVQAFSKCGKGFDLVVLDMRLPKDAKVPKEESERGGLYLLRRYARKYPHTMFVLSSGSHGRDECPDVALPSGFPAENFRCVPKTAGRDALLKILNRL